MIEPPRTPPRETRYARRPGFRAAAALCLALWAPAPLAAAQDPPVAEPYRGLFGTSDTTSAASPRPANAPRLLLDLGVSSLFESQLPSVAAAGGLDTSRRDNTHTALSASLARHLASRRATLDLQAGSQIRRYHDERGLTADRQSASATFETRMTRRSTLTLATSAAYSPTYTLSVPLTSAHDVADSAPPLGVEVDALRTASAGAGAKWSRRTGRQSTLDLAYDVTRVAFMDRGTADVTHRISARTTRDVRDGLSVRARYDFGRAASHPLGVSLGVTTHEVDLGVLYASRRWPDTRVTASIRPTLISRRVDDVSPEVAASVAATQPTGQGMRLGASASLEQRFGSTWRLNAGYQRALYSNEGFAQPAFAQTASVRAEGRLSRRMRVDTAVAYSTGLPNPLTPLRPLQHSVACSARWSVAASRTSVVFAEYRQTTYLEAGTVGASSAVLANLDRQGLRIGMTLNLRGH